ncbi:MAG: transcription termination/antitermination protein NusA [Candidatus Krumholzibacteriota bacterium]|nr:transcription termination/antitermination protein NusA [Candidatus Krumholzibacteriota bacterium]
MNTGFIEAFSQIIRVKRVDKNILVDTIKTSLISAARRKLGQEAEIQVHLDEAKGSIEIFRVYQVVKEVENEALELTLEKAKEVDEKAKVGQEVRQELSLEEFGRNAVQTAKQVLIQKVREAERERIFNDYKDKLGIIVSGTVRQVDRGNILVNLGRAEAYLPLREQIRKERYNQGETIRACVIEVDKDAKGPQIILSRTSNLFLQKLFEQEVPEIFDGDVEIKSIAREPGDRSKIAVHSRSDKVDAVGSCVGMKGSRVQAVVNELHGEKIDIVNWNESASEFVSRALAPSKVSALRFNEAEGEVLAIVEDDQLSLAIGREGQNVRLASKLSGWKINLTTVREVERRDKLEQKLQMDISEMYGVSKKMAQKLKSIGILTVQKLYKTTIEELLEVEGVGQKTAERLKTMAAETMEELNNALEELLEKEIKKEEEVSDKALFDEGALAPEAKKKKEEVELTEEALFGELTSGTGGGDEKRPPEGADQESAGETSGGEEVPPAGGEADTAADGPESGEEAGADEEIPDDGEPETTAESEEENNAAGNQAGPVIEEEAEGDELGAEDPSADDPAGDEKDQ